MASLLTQLGAVCDGCSTFNEPGVFACVRCGGALGVVARVYGDRAAGDLAIQAPRQGHLAVDTEPGPYARTTLPRGARPADLDTQARPHAQVDSRSASSAPPRGPEATNAPQAGVVALAAPAHLAAGALDAPQPGSTAAPRPGPVPLHAPLPGVTAAPKAGPMASPQPGPGRAPPPPPTRPSQAANRHLPLAPGAVHLTLLRGMGAALSVHHLSENETTLGRTVGEIRFPADATLGPRAATFRFQDGRLLIREAGSAVFVRLRHPEKISEGTWVAVGDQLLRYTGTIRQPRPGAEGLLSFGSPLPKGEPLLRLESLLLGGGPGRAWVRPAPIRLGRALGDVLLPDDPFVSARHCEFDWDQATGAVIVRDLGSSNGTFLRIPPGAEKELQPGDTIRVGRNILRVDRVGGTTR